MDQYWWHEWEDNNSLLDQQEPTNRIEMLEKARSWVWKIGLLYRIIKLKVDFASAGFEPRHEDEGVENFYKDLYEELDIEKFVRAAAFEHEVIGEWYPFYTWDDTGRPKNITVLNPKLTEVDSILGQDIIRLKPTESFSKLLSKGNSAINKKLKEVVPDYIFKKWRQGSEVVLEEDNCQRYVNMKAYHEDYTNPPIMSILSDLKIMRTLQEADYATAKQLKQSILQIKVGDKDFDNGEPVDGGVIEDVIEQFEESCEGFSTIEWFTQWFVNAEYIIPDMEVFDAEKYKGAIRNIINWSGLNVFLEEAGSFGASYIKVKGVKQAVQNTRNVIRKALNHFNKLVAEKQGLTYYGKPKVPQIRFDANALEEPEELRKIVAFLYEHGLLSEEDTLDWAGYNLDRQIRKKEEEQEHEDIISVPFLPGVGNVEEEEGDSTDNVDPNQGDSPHP